MPTIDLNDIAKEVSLLGEVLTAGLSRMKYGSYRDRNPHLGRLRTCPNCHKRTYEFGTDSCCSAEFATHIRDRKVEGIAYLDCAPREAEFSMKKLQKKMRSHMRPGYGTRWGKEIYDTAISFQEEKNRQFANLLLRGLAGFHEPQRNVELAHIPSFASEVVAARKKGEANRKRNTLKLSRKINRG